MSSVMPVRAEMRGGMGSKGLIRELHVSTTCCPSLTTTATSVMPRDLRVPPVVSMSTMAYFTLRRCG